ncbi:hypothetical protein EV359DRAFT_32010 [Lentinula novae-zelandiae]|nr:hypothetical protein EV359DRAFT_32010 [Lentinula novae-zelandiae]
MSTSLFVSVQCLSKLLPAAERSNSFDQETVNKLEKRLSQRPEKTDLVDRNILKGTVVLTTYFTIDLNPTFTDDKGIAPSLVAAKEKLQRSQLEDKLGQALQQRPKPEELVKEGILLGERNPLSPCTKLTIDI